MRIKIMTVAMVIIAFYSCGKAKKAYIETSLTSSSNATVSNVTTINGIDSSLIHKYKIGTQVPIDQFIDPDNKVYSMNDWIGKNVLIDFWATWCSPCIDDQPFLELKRKEFSSDNIEFISISIDDDKSFWKAFISDKNLTENEYWIGDKPHSPLYSLTYSVVRIERENVPLVSLPTYTLINEKGEIVNRDFARPSNTEFSKRLRKILDETE